MRPISFPGRPMIRHEGTRMDARVRAPVNAECDDRIMAAVESAARFLPTQGPIGVFIAQNAITAFEVEPFEDAVVHAGALYGAEPYLSEERYRQELARGRIRAADLEAVLDRDLGGTAGGPLVGGRLTVRDLRRSLLLHPVRHESDAAVRWTLTERDFLERLRSDLSPEVRWRLLSGDIGEFTEVETAFADADDETARRTTFLRSSLPGEQDEERRVSRELWHACVEAVSLARPSIASVSPPVRHRDLILAADPAIDTDVWVHPILIRICGAFLDQGVAAWPMPCRDRGILQAAARLYGGRFGPKEAWSGGLSNALRQVRGMAAVAVIAQELRRLGVPEASWDEFLTRTTLALRGWAGLIRQFEERPDRAPVEAVPARLVDFVALRLVFDRVAAEHAWKLLAGDSGARSTVSLLPEDRLAALWTELRDRYPRRRGPGSLSRAYLLHQVSQLLGLTARDVLMLDDNEILRLEHAVASFDGVARRRLFHLAYERRYRVELLDALACHDRFAVSATPSRPRFQFVLCMDERCESFRRHLEELGPEFETLGTAGFFGVAMYYRGIDDWHAVPLCPIVMRPGHTVVEAPEHGARAWHEFQRTIRRRFGQVAGGVAAGSRTLLRGGVFTAFAGAIAAVPLVARVAFPRLAARMGERAADLARRRVPTRLVLERQDDDFLADGTQAGFHETEMAAIVRRVLEDIGLTRGFSRLVAIVGHGSSSLNNPHESAYDCGACGGGPGGANARAFAMMANNSGVRARLAADGLRIPVDTRFIGGIFDTCADTVTWFDADVLPESHRHDVETLRRAAELACIADAHERCRRFESAPLDIAPRDAARHVEARSVDLAQVRPEFGHATNAAAIIGRRSRTRGLFLDRRAFLVSYDPTDDDDGAILSRTLAAVVPVAGGINLAYYFSAVDKLAYGCGTKLPHNITGLIGVMDGHASDLRTGLPWQTVEIHEPQRLLVVIEAPVERIVAAVATLLPVRQFVQNRWIQLVAMDPASGSLSIYDEGAFVPYMPERNEIPVVDRSVSWYSGKRDHLAPARVLAALAARPGPDGGPSA